MADYQQIVDNIRGFISSTNQLVSSELADWASEYTRLCRDANDRLRRCSEYLQKGLRSEAIHLAGQAPNLLDLVAALDFPEVQDWTQISFQYELPQAQPLLLEAAAALNEAYAETQPLEALLAHHRLLALAHAPLNKRLSIVRQLGQMDPAGPFWDEDIRACERSRIEEIRTSMPQIARGGNAGAAQQIQDELDAPLWRETVPPELRRAISDTAKRLRGISAEADLRKLLPVLHDAYGAMAFDETKRLLGQWLAIVAAGQINLPVDLQEQLAPISDWVAQQQRLLRTEGEFTEACNRLQEAIDTDAPAVELERTHEAVQHFGREIPERLRERYRHRIESLEAGSRHRRTMVYSIIAAAFVLAAGAAIFFAYQSVRAREARDTEIALREAQTEVERGDAERGQLLMTQVLDQHPRIVSNPIVVRAVAELNQAMAAERQRTAEFQSRLKAATDAGVEHPDMQSLQQATTLAKTKGETELVGQLREQIDEVAHAQQRERDSQFSAEGSALATDISQILTANLLTEHPDNFERQLEELRGRGNAISRAQGQITPDLFKAQLDSITALLKQKGAQLESVSLERSLLQGIVLATTPEQRAAALQNYVDKCPTSPRVADFQQVLKMADAEKAAEAWDRVAVGWTGVSIPASYQNAEARAGQLRQYVKDFPVAAFPITKPVKNYLDYLEVGLKVSAKDGPWKKSFFDLMNNPLVHDLKYLETVVGTRYYVLPNCIPKLQKIGEVIAGYSFEAVLSPDISKTKAFVLRAPDKLKEDTPSVSPQAVFAAAELERITALDFSDWDVIGSRIVGDLVAKPDMNIVLEGLLLQNALSANQPVYDWMGDVNCAQIQKQLAALNLDDMPWLDPAKPPSALVVGAIAKLAATLPPAKNMELRICKKRDAMVAALPGRLMAAGIVTKGPMPLRLRSGAPGANGASMAYAIGNDGELLAIAQLESGIWRADESQLKSAPDGAIVFVGGPIK